MACDTKTKSLATAKVCHWSKHAALFNMSEGQGGQACNTLLCVLRPKSKYAWHRFKCVWMKGVIQKDEIQCRICNNETNDVARYENFFYFQVWAACWSRSSWSSGAVQENLETGQHQHHAHQHHAHQHHAHQHHHHHHLQMSYQDDWHQRTITCVISGSPCVAWPVPRGFHWAAELPLPLTFWEFLQVMMLVVMLGVVMVMLMKRLCGGDYVFHILKVSTTESSEIMSCSLLRWMDYETLRLN